MHFGDANDPNAIFFGAFATLESSMAVEDNPVVRAHDLALQELSGDGTVGLPGGPRGARRPLVMIVCNNDRAVVDKGIAHLADDVQVPALLAWIHGYLARRFEAHPLAGGRAPHAGAVRFFPPTVSEGVACSAP